MVHRKIFKSNHLAFFFKVENIGSGKAVKEKHIFRFEKLWTRIDGCEGVINAWERVDGCNENLGLVKENLNVCAFALSNWNWNTIGHVQKRLSKLDEDLQVAFYLIDMDRVRSLEREINSLLEYDEIMCR